MTAERPLHSQHQISETLDKGIRCKQHRTCEGPNPLTFPANSTVLVFHESCPKPAPSTPVAHKKPEATESHRRQRMSTMAILPHCVHAPWGPTEKSEKTYPESLLCQAQSTFAVSFNQGRGVKLISNINHYITVICKFFSNENYERKRAWCYIFHKMLIRL